MAKCTDLLQSAKKDVQRHLKYAEDSMAKGNAKNVLNAKDVIIKTVDQCDGRSTAQQQSPSSFKVVHVLT